MAHLREAKLAAFVSKILTEIFEEFRCHLLHLQNSDQKSNKDKIRQNEIEGADSILVCIFLWSEFCQRSR